MTTIPRIVLDDRAVAADNPDPASSSSSLLPTSTTNGPMLVRTLPGGATSAAAAGAAEEEDSASPTTAAVVTDPPHHQYVPHRCNSDIGLPTTSMPNLPLAMGLGGGGSGGGEGGGDKLGVYCSPRTTRRSVDLDLVHGGSGGSSSGRGDPAARVEYEWLAECGDKSSSLQVLSAGSRVGSAVSLNSVCTAHSVGLLSNDSSDEYPDSYYLHDVTTAGSLPPGGFHLPPPHSERASHLRRLQSTPEAEVTGGSDAAAGAGSHVTPTPRTSYSLCNLKAAQQAVAPPGLPLSGLKDQGGQNRGGLLTPEKLCLLPSDLDDECEDNHHAPLPPREAGKREQEQEEEGREGEAAENAKEDPMEVCSSEDSQKSHMVSYGKGSTTMREGRIRRWLQDMDKASE